MELDKATGRPPVWPDRNANGLRSAMYEGVLVHARFGPGPTHSFSYKVAMPLLDLAEVDDVMSLHPAWSARRAARSGSGARISWGTRPYPSTRRCGTWWPNAPGGVPMARSPCWPTCAPGAGCSTPSASTSAPDVAGPPGEPGRIDSWWPRWRTRPWHERHAYVVGPPGRHRFAKELHVSPFLPPRLDYELRYTAPGPRLTVGLDVLQADQRLFAATLFLRRRALDRAALGRLLWNYPAMTHRITGGIYAQAARLRLKGAPFFGHPAPERRTDIVAPVLSAWASWHRRTGP